MFVCIFDMFFFIDDVVNVFLYGVVVVVILVWDIEVCGMVVVGGYGCVVVMIKGE